MPCPVKFMPWPVNDTPAAFFLRRRFLRRPLPFLKGPFQVAPLRYTPEPRLCFLQPQPIFLSLNKMQSHNVKQSSQMKKAAEFTRLKTNTRPVKFGFYVEKNSKDAQKKTGKLYKFSKTQKFQNKPSAWNYGTGKLTADGRLQPVAWSRQYQDTRSLVQ